MTTTTTVQPEAAPDRAGGLRASWYSGTEGWEAADAQAVTTAAGDPVALGRFATELALTAGLVDRPSLVLGALPFDTRGDAVFLRPGSLDRITGGAGGAACDPPERAAYRVMESTPTREGYAGAVRTLLADFEAGTVDKVVLARQVELFADQDVDPGAVAERLRHLHPFAHVFNIPVPQGGSLVGASPELLVSKRGGTVRSHPLAGSAHRSRDLTTDAENAERLSRSEKDLREHAYVVEAIADTLAPYCSRLQVPREPSLVGTCTMWHLGTFIDGDLRDPQTPVVELAAALHPTPAICGYPTEAAQRRIHDLEGFDRGYYAGAVGWTDEHGDGEWAVAIRCAHVEGTRVLAYAGAGIVAGSDPVSEVAETAGKMRAFASALGDEVLA